MREDRRDRQERQCTEGTGRGWREWPGVDMGELVCTGLGWDVGLSPGGVWLCRLWPPAASASLYPLTLPQPASVRAPHVQPWGQSRYPVSSTGHGAQDRELPARLQGPSRWRQMRGPAPPWVAGVVGLGGQGRAGRLGWIRQGPGGSAGVRVGPRGCAELGSTPGQGQSSGPLSRVPGAALDLRQLQAAPPPGTPARQAQHSTLQRRRPSHARAPGNCVEGRQEPGDRSPRQPLAPAH